MIASKLRWLTTAPATQINLVVAQNVTTGFFRLLLPSLSPFPLLRLILHSRRFVFGETLHFINVPVFFQLIRSIHSIIQSINQSINQSIY